MHASLFLMSALAASAWAAPAFPKINADASLPDNLQTLSEYFNLLAVKVRESKSNTPPVCDLSKVSLPPAASGLPPPSSGLTLKHIAIGRGTQNYTCDPTKPDEAPKAAGAVATLFNASCLAASTPDLATTLGRAAMHFDLPQLKQAQQLSPSNLILSGVHFFTDATTALFKLESPSSSSPPQQQGWNLGQIPCGKTAATPAPEGAGKGLKGEGAVPWLKLVAKPGATGGLQEVYRVETVGGSAPATCKGLPGSFEVQYATQYWFYAS